MPHSKSTTLDPQAAPSNRPIARKRKPSPTLAKDLKAGFKINPNGQIVLAPAPVETQKPDTDNTTGTVTQTGKSSKQLILIELLKRDGGATLDELMIASGWQKHSVRGFISGTARKKLGLRVTSRSGQNGVRTYLIDDEAA